jgi:hypothetical protein
MVVDVLSRIRKSENGYLQGGIFLSNLLIRSIKHLVIQRRCRLAFGSKSWRLRQYKKSDTLFILGSGESIAGYTEGQFKEIARHDSVGFNFWLLHPYVPTYYVVEFQPKCERSETLWLNLERRAKDYAEVPVIIKYSAAFWGERHLLPKILKNIFVALNLSIPGMTRTAFSRWLAVLDSLKMLDCILPVGLIPYRQASLSWLFVFALQLGYKKIVLCGVDLNTPKYFYEISQDYCHGQNLLIPPSGFTTSVHPTNSQDYCIGGLPITDVLHVMDDVLLKKRGIEIFIGAQSSALYPGFPVYDW